MNSNLKNKINQDIVSALKSGLSDVVLTLRFLMSVIKNNELLKRNKLSKESASRRMEEELIKLSELTDEEIINVILGEIKKGEKAIDQYEKGGRPDLVLKGKSEIEILKKYFPQ